MTSSARPPSRARTSPSRAVALGAVAAVAGALAAGALPASRAPGPAGPAIAAGPPTTFRGAERATLSLLGPIGPDAASAFEAASARMRPGDLVFVSSPGGLVGQAMAIGRSVRARGLAVVVGQAPGPDPRPGRCVSACTLILAAGVDRTAVEGSLVAVHAVAPLPGSGAAGAAGLRSMDAEVASYLAGLGMAPALSAAMERSARPTALSWSETAMLGLVNRRPLSTAPR